MSSKPTPLTPEFDDLVNTLLTEWRVPCTSIAIIDGPDTFAKGYGTAIYPSTKATPETLYYTASTTKSFVAAAVSLLIDDDSSNKPHEKEPNLDQGEGKLTWQTPLNTLIRDDFVLEDPYATTHITIEDALSHRTGLPDHTRQWGPDGASVKDEVRKLRYLPLSAEIRTKYMYNSLMYTAVSHAIETVTGRGLGSFLRERVWVLLDMARTYWSLGEVRDAGKEDLLARGYAWDEAKGEYVPEAYPEYSGLSGAGCMISSVMDYAKWLRCFMQRSGPLSARGHEELVKARILTYESATNPFPGPHLYALGWRVDSYRGEQVIWHTGGINGYGTLMMFLPARQWGVVIVGNTRMTSNMMQVVLYMRLLDGVLGTPGGERVDWGGVLRGRWEARRAGMVGAREQLYPHVPTPAVRPAFGVEEHVGRYWHPAYLGMDIVLGEDGKGLVGDRLRMEVGMEVHLEHVSGEFWLARLEVRNQDPRDYEVVRAEFRVGLEGVKAVGVALEPEMSGKLIWFQRID
ncbi:hypothetical protein BBP40_006989 [Aspergillus hancockii]|nr:hypothetical protein BBP40_006989 [Aspergillus hancockii]